MDEKGAACWKAGGSRAILGEEEKPAKEGRRSPAAPPQMGALQEVEEEKKR